jgi:steroid 5-alpha reductase family enzyme
VVVAALLIVNAIITALCFVALWLMSLRLKDVSFIDAWWALGLVVIAGVSFMNSPPGAPHAILLAALCAIWGLRLGLYLLWRWRQNGPDRRYVKILARSQQQGWSFAAASFLFVFALQAPLQFIVSLPVQLGQLAHQPLGPLAYAGAALAVFGIAFESIGDWQLTRFRANPANQGKVLDTGLWRYTRHPNYFGDACVWWGLWLIAADAGFGAWTLPGPVLITYLLTSLSGVPTVENHLKRSRRDYDAYVARTSGFIPLPPKQPAR